METKTGPQFIKEIKGRTVTGIFAVHGNLDQGDDVSHPGSFTKTITERLPKIKFLWQHDMRSPPVARVVGLREVSRDDLPKEALDVAPEATGGVEVVREYLNTPRGNEILECLNAKAITEMSYAYDAIKYDFETVNDVRRRNLREVKLFEVSDVLWGMNPATVADSKTLLPLDLVAKALETLAAQAKEGRRHSAEDLSFINAIHAASVQLGSDQCAGVVNEKAGQSGSRADADSWASLTQGLRGLDDLLIATI